MDLSGKKQSHIVMLKKIIDYNDVNKIQVFKQNCVFTTVTLRQPDIQKISGHINKCDVLILYNKLCQLLKDLYNSINW